jgi:hydroxypyruvate isomerase
MPRLSANLTMMFGEVPFPDRFAAAARAGFRAVEFVAPYELPAARAGELVREHGLEVSVFNLPPGNWAAGDRGIGCDPARVGEFQDGVGRAIEYARAMGARQVHAMAGIAPRGVAADRLRETYVANLRFAAGKLAEHGIGLLVEAINTRDIPGYFLTTSRQAFALMDEAALPTLRFQYDVYHLQIMEGDLAPTLERNVARIGHVQIADTPGRHEPGTGEINYRFLLRHLDRIGYAGWIGCEYKPLGATEAGLGWIREVTGA